MKFHRYLNCRLTRPKTNGGGCCLLLFQVDSNSWYIYIWILRGINCNQGSNCRSDDPGCLEFVQPARESIGKTWPWTLMAGVNPWLNKDKRALCPKIKKFILSHFRIFEFCYSCGKLFQFSVLIKQPPKTGRQID